MTDPAAPPVVAVVGATATGKSDVGVELARRLGGEVVNADAMQLYRGMDVGTAKLTPAERRGVAHHQLDVLDLVDEASVAAYQREARRDIDAIRACGGVPVLVGGSGLYVRAALDLLDIPPTDPAVRARLQQEAERRGLPVLVERLRVLDPVAAERILATNARRVVRALEVIELTGRPFSASMPERTHRLPTVMIGLRADRAVLDERLAARVARMWEQGLLDEVRMLEPRGLREGRTAAKAIGYAQALGQLDGRLDEQQAQEETTALTRRLARRQEAWFRPDPRIRWHDTTSVLTGDRAPAELHEQVHADLLDGIAALGGDWAP
ncbi:tRNA (adenosine(37)-N6)-dimethylallyltransferase MiaA [Arsenicicoccus dermatophilus]|uniref:tRNA (adenosine(37)-N6)-dimethylallyltransferase MiaA n=1 Tax=Arsenicicoccus dermatophilus TaxID=1076331 RepID=UPI001F4CC037|nr:tRNA (adenosine(37)-N6)-dimethylallyltransferase MiaA [Arsenicicoccus dermatophilus]MCH8612839.1 tRNA (adenosine(37)-N6)-dimethylallyltransferase MiaA [Arsenicicoccus dermatophilus]